jgi:positive regulator of sigma E activity
VAGAWLGGSASESLSIISALLGLLVGGLIVSRQSKKTRNDLRYQPVLLDGSDAVKHLSLL